MPSFTHSLTISSSRSLRYRRRAISKYSHSRLFHRYTIRMYYCAPRERGRGGRERDRASLCAAYIRDRRHLCSPSNTTSFYEMFSLHSFPSVQGVVCVEHNIIEMRNCMHTACSNLPHNPHTCNTHIHASALLFSSAFFLFFSYTIGNPSQDPHVTRQPVTCRRQSPVTSLHLLDTRLSRLRRLTTIHEAALPYSVRIIRRSILLHNT